MIIIFFDFGYSIRCFRVPQVEDHCSRGLWHKWNQNVIVVRFPLFVVYFFIRNTFRIRKLALLSPSREVLLLS
jgi:hypothetical protein